MTLSDREPLMTIQVVARVTGLHPQTLRKYERWGYITPARTLSNMRLYTMQDVEIIKRIRRLTETLGLNQAGVELILGIQRIMIGPEDADLKLQALGMLLGVEQGRGHVDDAIVQERWHNLIAQGEGELELTPVPTRGVEVRGSWGPQNVTFRRCDNSACGGVDLDDVAGRVQIRSREVE
jgi:DNA-binding transcriptional MerR regulator